MPLVSWRERYVAASRARTKGDGTSHLRKRGNSSSALLEEDCVNQIILPKWAIFDLVRHRHNNQWHTAMP